MNHMKRSVAKTDNYIVIIFHKSLTKSVYCAFQVISVNVEININTFCRSVVIFLVHVD